MAEQSKNPFASGVALVRVQDDLHGAEIRGGGLFLPYLRDDAYGQSRNTMHWSVNSVVGDHAYGRFNETASGELVGRVAIIAPASDLPVPAGFGQVDTWYRLDALESPDGSIRRGLGVGRDAVVVAPDDMHVPEGINVVRYSGGIEVRDAAIAGVLNDRGVEIQQAAMRGWVGHPDSLAWANETARQLYGDRADVIHFDGHADSLDDKIETSTNRVRALLESFEKERLYTRGDGSEVPMGDVIRAEATQARELIRVLRATMPPHEATRVDTFYQRLDGRLQDYEGQAAQIERGWAAAFEQGQAEPQATQQVPLTQSMTPPPLPPVRDAADTLAPSTVARANPPDQSPASGQARTYLTKLPFERRHDAIAIGAQLDKERRQYYVPPGVDAKPFKAWIGKAKKVERPGPHSQDPESRRAFWLNTPFEDMSQWRDLGGNYHARESANGQHRDVLTPEGYVVGQNAQTGDFTVPIPLLGRDEQGRDFAQRFRDATTGQARHAPETVMPAIAMADAPPLSVEPTEPAGRGNRRGRKPQERGDYYQELTDRLIEQLEKGTAPWQKPWDGRTAQLPYNALTGNAYSGTNSLYLSMVAAANGLDDPRWVTYKQAEGKGWQVMRGQKGVQLQKWIFNEERTLTDANGAPLLDGEGKPRKQRVELERPKLSYFTVFHASQIANMPELEVTARTHEWNPEEKAERILQQSGARIFHDQGDRAYYSPVSDEIHMPRRDQFPSAQAYYGTALHELGHWTGHESRLNRNLGNSFGSVEYAKEELRAELASYFLGDQLGVHHDTERHAAYVKSWVEVLREDKGEIFRAASDAQKIANYVIGLDRTIERDASVERTADVEKDAGVTPALSVPSEATAARSPEPAAPAIVQPEPLDKWHPAQFQVKEIQFESVGHYLAFSKAKVFGDEETAAKILVAKDRGEQQALGRQVSGYVDQTWLARRERIEVVGQREKFLQNPPLRDVLMAAPVGALDGVLNRARTQIVAMDLQREDAPAHAVTDVKAIKAARRGTEPQQGDTVLAVPYSERRKASDHGAVWAPKAEVWYAPKGVDLEPLSKWREAKQRSQLPAELAQNAREDFRKALVDFGLRIEGDHPIMDGQIHRVPLRDGKRGRSDGAYFGHLDGIKPAGWMLNHTTGLQTNWSGEGLKLSKDEIARAAAEQALAAQMRKAADDTKHLDAARRLGARWGYLKAEPEAGKQTYLDRKQVPGYGVKFDGDKMVVPLRDVNGKIWSLQTLLPQKIELEPGADPIDKLLAKNAKKEGRMHVMGEIKAGEPVIVAEGYATAASIRLATGHTTVMAVDSGNLEPVVRALREKYPTTPLFIGADDDRFPNAHTGQLRNAGLIAAIEASTEHGAGVLVPKFGVEGKLTDWNDLHVNEGIGEVKRQIEEGIAMSVEQSRSRAQEIVAQQLGEHAKLQTPGLDTRHTGEVLGVTQHHVAQSVGGDTGVVHETRRLDAKPETGRVATVQYANGRGKVTDRTQEKALQRGAEVQR